MVSVILLALVAQDVNWGALNQPNVGTSAMDGFYRAREAAMRERVAEAERRRLDAETRRLDADTKAIEKDDLPRQVGSLIAAGRCDEAFDTALRGGDLDLAAKVKPLCK